jgi:DNA-binding sugar fermentation-stimulating protein
MEKEYITINSYINSQVQYEFIANYIIKVYDIMYEAAYNNKTFEFKDDFNFIIENNELTSQ